MYKLPFFLLLLLVGPAFPKQTTPAVQFETRKLAEKYNYLAPDGSEIRLLPSMGGGGLCHCTLGPGKISKAVRHKTVEEIWYVIEGKGQVWRKQGAKESVVDVAVGSSLTIPVGVHFQFRTKGKMALKILIATMPPWPGPKESIDVRKHWDR